MAVFVIHVLRDDGKQHLKVLIDVEPVGLYDLYQTVEHSTGLGPVVGIDKDEACLPSVNGRMVCSYAYPDISIINRYSLGLSANHSVYAYFDKK